MKKRNRILILLMAVLLFVSALPMAAFAETGSPKKDVRVGFFSMENFMEGDGTMSPQTLIYDRPSADRRENISLQYGRRKRKFWQASGKRRFVI